MSLYNQLFGFSPQAPRLLKILNLSNENIPRFRDCFLQSIDDKLFIVIHTRTGGGNRGKYDKPDCSITKEDDYKGPWNSDLRKHPLFIREEDCPHDTTFANFYFAISASHFPELLAMHTKDPAKTPEEKWKQLPEDMKSGKGEVYERSTKLAETLFGQMNEDIKSKKGQVKIIEI